GSTGQCSRLQEYGLTVSVMPAADCGNPVTHKLARRRWKMALIHRCRDRRARIAAVLGLVVLAGCGKGGPDADPVVNPVSVGGTTTVGGAAMDPAPLPPTAVPAAGVDPWRHRPGAGEVIEPGELITVEP